MPLAWIQVVTAEMIGSNLIKMLGIEWFTLPKGISIL